MSSLAIAIPQRRSLLLFAILAMFMVLVSYLFILLLAVACVYLPWLAISNAPNFQTLVLFVGGIVIAAIMVWSLIPRFDKFEAPGLPPEPASHPRLFAEIKNIAMPCRNLSRARYISSALPMPGLRIVAASWDSAAGE
jgi:hypothetical protein